MKSKRIRFVEAGSVLLSSRFRDPAQRFSFGWARLYGDRIVFYGLTWRGWYRDTIPLEEVARVEWWTGEPHEVNFVLHLHDRTTVGLWIAGSGLWKYEVEACLGQVSEHQSELPGQVTSASAA